MEKQLGAGENPGQLRDASGRGRPAQPIGRILIAIDLTDSAEPVPLDALSSAHQVRHHGGSGAAPRLVAEAIPLAQALGASVEIVYVRETRSQGAVAGSPTVDVVDDWVDRRLEEIAEAAAAAGVECLTTSLQGSARRTLVEHVKKTEPDLVILGSHARWHLLKTCSEQVLRDARRRILVVPIDDPELIG